MLALIFVSLPSLCEETAAQPGALNGKIVDAEFGDPMIGVSVRIEDSDRGAATDLDGRFRIDQLAAGIYNVYATYVGYKAVRITDVVIKAGETTTLNFQMQEEALQGEEVVIEARRIDNTEAALLTMQKRAPSVSDGISAEQIKKSPDSDAADAVKRITGVTVIGGKFVYVRGMGERYNNTRLNGASISSPEPKKRTVPFDIIPAGLVDNIVVSKTFTPDQPGDFAGGSIQITTKEFPEELTVNASQSVSYNDHTTFKDFDTYWGGNTDWLGIDDGSRAIPDRVLSGDFGDNPNISVQREKIKEFRNVWEPQTVNAPLNSSESFSVGNSTELLGKPFGYLATLTYSNSYERRTEYDYDYNANTVDGVTTLEKVADLVTDKSTRSIQWGGLLDLNTKLSGNHKLSLKSMYTRGADDEVRTMIGIIDGQGPYSNQRLTWTERSLASINPKGSHQLEGLFNSRLDWSFIYSRGTFDEPDRRDNYYIYDSDHAWHWLGLRGARDASFRRYAEMRDNVYESTLDWTLPFQWRNREQKLKIGGLYRTMDRDFPTWKYYYMYDRIEGAPALPDTLPPETLFSPEFVDSYFKLAAILNPTDPYTATMEVKAAYLMADMLLAPKWRVVGGARIEDTDQYYKTFPLAGDTSSVREEGGPKHTDVLPSLNITYKLNENANLRLAGSKTIANPDYVELVPTEDMDYYEGTATRGYGQLKHTKITNLDLRWEAYPRIGENVMVGLFYKRIVDPIEWIIIPQASGITEIKPRNLVDSDNYGIELETRKRLDFMARSVGGWIQYFSVIGNVTLVKSTVDLKEPAFDAMHPEIGSGMTSKERPMMGQSDYIVNLTLSYDQPHWGSNIRVLYNTFGERISRVGGSGIPDTYEQPFDRIDVALNQRLNQNWAVKLQGKNLLNSEVLFKTGDEPMQRYRKGRLYSFGLSYAM